jgi:pimeloyl-ACP methyl ester carboxylesterase
VKKAIVFPGIGYTCRRPLLYYTAMLAAERGFDVMRLDYGTEVHSMRCRDADALAKAAELAYPQAAEQIRKAGISRSDGRILMISKSVGTLVAARIEAELGIGVIHFMMTPIPAVIPFLEKTDGLFLSGTGDPYISAEQVRSAARRLPDRAVIFEGCNHSLERPGHTKEALENLSRTVQLLDGLIGSCPEWNE